MVLIFYSDFWYYSNICEVLLLLQALLNCHSVVNSHKISRMHKVGGINQEVTECWFVNLNIAALQDSGVALPCRMLAEPHSRAASAGVAAPWSVSLKVSSQLHNIQTQMWMTLGYLCCTLLKHREHDLQSRILRFFEISHVWEWYSYALLYLFDFHVVKWGKLIGTITVPQQGTEPWPSSLACLILLDKKCCSWSRRIQFGFVVK